MTAAILALNARTFSSLRKHRNYRLFFMGQLVSLAGTWMQNAALAWFVLELTNSPTAVGILALCRFGPFTVFGLFAGVLADRFDNRRLVMVTQTAAMITSIALAALALSGAAEVWHAYVLAALGGTALVFDAPGRHALTYQLVGPAELPNAVALNASMFNAARIVGPAIGGLTIAAFGVGLCFAVNAVSFLAVLASLLVMRTGELVPLETGRERPTIIGGIREGLSYARHDPIVRLLLALVLVISTAALNFNVLLPVLAEDTLDAGPEVFGLLSAVFGAGALAGALLTAALGRASLKAIYAGLGGFGLTLLLLATQRSIWTCAVLLAVAGVCFTFWMSNSQSILQLTAPDHLRGRVLGLYLFAFAGSAPVGGLMAGWLSEIGGTSLAFVVGGALAVGATLIALTKAPGALVELRARAAAEAPV